MKQLITSSLLFICLFACIDSFAQVTTFTGRIVDEHNYPVPGSKIKIYKSGRVTEMTADKDGVFSASLIPDNYFVDINADGRFFRATKILLQPEGRVKTFFNFKLYSKGVAVSLMAQDKLIAGRLP